MGRPREFDEAKVLQTAGECFWEHGYEATSMRDIVAKTGLTGPSLYNAFGDKRALYERALDHYVERSILDRIRRCELLPPVQAIESFFDEILRRSLSDPAHKGCMLVNATLEVGMEHPSFKATLAKSLLRIENFFCHQSCAARRLVISVLRKRPPNLRRTCSVY